MILDWTSCENCSHQEPCWSSRWNGGHNRPPGHPQPSAPEIPSLSGLTDVHTCFTCGNRVFGLFDEYAGERRIVPDDCPRWDASFGSGTDCAGCNLEREQLRDNHPNRELQREAAGKFVEVFASTLKRGPGTDELADKRDAKSAVAALAHADNPAHWVPEYLEAYPELVVRADALMSAIVQSTLNQPKVAADWAKFQDWQQVMFLSEWVQACILACHRHEDAEAAAWETWLTVTKNTAIRRAFVFLKTSERQLIHRGWVAALRDVKQTESA